jgi:hypothetical protein
MKIFIAFYGIRWFTNILIQAATVSTLSQINRICTPTIYFLINHFNIILQCTFWSSVLQDFLAKQLYTFRFSFMLHVLPISRSLFYHPTGNITVSDVSVMR